MNAQRIWCVHNKFCSETVHKVSFSLVNSCCLRLRGDSEIDSFWVGPVGQLVVCLSIYPVCISLSYLAIDAYLAFHLSIYPSIIIYLLICPIVYRSVHLIVIVCSSIYPPINSFVHTSICPLYHIHRLIYLREMMVQCDVPGNIYERPCPQSHLHTFPHCSNLLQ